MFEWRSTYDNKNNKGWPFDPLKWLASNFSLHYNPWTTYLGYKNMENDHLWNKLLIVKQLLLVSIVGNV